jgi:hypothetical protein
MNNTPNQAESTTSTMTDQFNDPGATSGDSLPLADLLGNLLMFTVDRESDPIETKHGVATAIKCAVVVLDGDSQGTTYDDVLIFPKVLKNQLKDSAGGGKVLGRLGQGANVKGNPPWLLETATDADKDLARQWISAKAQPVAAGNPFD